MNIPPPALLTWTICLLATAGVIFRPFKLPEAIWAAAGAVLLLVLGLLPLPAGLRAIAKGTDVYLFLTGMMLLSETARQNGLFDTLAALAARAASGSIARLFTLIYAIGTLVTIFMSNDATAVVLTPAVYAAARGAKAEPLPLLFACALIANAASFALPISNPANLVLYGHALPRLLPWLRAFALPSALAIAATYIALRLIFRRALTQTCATAATPAPLSPGGWIALAGIAATAAALLTASALGAQLGWPTALAGAATAAAALLRKRAAPWPLLRAISWSVLPLVAGLFVLVAALDHTGVIRLIAQSLRNSGAHLPAAAGAAIALASNLMNNLPAGLIASSAIAQSHPLQAVIDSLLIGVDIGPNLSITGSLATILWLNAIRREGEDVTFWRFLKIGALATPPALAVALAARLLI